MKSAMSYRPVLECLQDRKLLASSLTADYEYVSGVGGVLYIEGTDQSDTIVVRQTNGWLSVDGVAVNGAYPAVPASFVNVIGVNALGGHDYVYLNSEATGYGQQPIHIPALIDAGAGNDLVFGSAGSNIIDGGIGDDVLHGNAANDFLMGSSGNDRLYGHSGHDRLFGGDGTDVLFGGWGIDILHGGTGVDYLLGEQQDDALFVDGSDWYFDRDGFNSVILNGTARQLDQAIRIQEFEGQNLDSIESQLAESIAFANGQVSGSNAYQLFGDLDWAFDTIHNLSTKRGDGPVGLWMANLTPGV